MKFVTLLFRFFYLFSVVLIPTFSHRLYLFSPFFSSLPFFLVPSLSVFAAFPFFHGFASLWVNANGLYDVMKNAIKDHIVSFPPMFGFWVLMKRGLLRLLHPVRLSCGTSPARPSGGGTAAVHQDLHSQRVPVPNSLLPAPSLLTSSSASCVAAAWKVHGRAGGAYTPRSVRRRLGNFCHHIEVLLLLRLAHFAPPLFSSSTAAVRAASWRFTARLCERGGDVFHPRRVH